MASIARQQAMSAIQTQLLQAAPVDPNKTQPIPASAPANRAIPDPKQQKQQAQQQKQQQAERERNQRISEQARNIGEQARRKAIAQGQVLVRTTTDAVQRTGGVIEHVPTPGGLFVPLITLMVLWLTLLPVNGHTRLVWFFLALVGQAHLTGVPSTEGQVLLPNIQIASGNWPAPSNTPNSNTGQKPITPNTPTSTKPTSTKPTPTPTPTPTPMNTTLHTHTQTKKPSIVDQLHHTTHI